MTGRQVCKDCGRPWNHWPAPCQCGGLYSKIIKDDLPDGTEAETESVILRNVGVVSNNETTLQVCATGLRQDDEDEFLQLIAKVLT